SWPESLPLDGLPDGNDRLWAARNGSAAREFTVTPAAAEAHIRRGVPFLITVIDGGFGHTQLAVGYDPLRESVRLRGPYDRVATESPLAPLLQRYRGTGPRGLALVPAGKAGLLEGLELPDADLYDRAFE